MISTSLSDMIPIEFYPSLINPSIDLSSMLREAMANIDTETLLNSCTLNKYSNKLLEKAWHFELYRSICDCLPKDIYVSPEVGKAFTDNGIVDLYIPRYQWAIELLIDGKDFKKHYDRFKPGSLFLFLISFPFFIVISIFIDIKS